MGEKKRRKQLLGSLLAFTMLVTQLGVWNAGKESVQAAENNGFTLYYYNESTEPLYVNIWNWAGISFAEDAEVTSEFGWGHDLAVMKAVDGNENWYSVTFEISDAEADDGFTIYQNGTGDSNKLVEYDNQWNNPSDYANFVSGTESVYAVKDGNIYTNLSEAGLNMEDQADDEDNDDNSTEYNLQITADNTTVEAGDTVNLTAVLKKGQTEITDLEAAGLHLYWWNNTTNSSSEFIDYDGNSGYSLTLQTTPGTVGTNEIQAKLQDAEWKDIVVKKIEITVNEASNSVKDAPIAVTKVNNLSSDFIMGMDISSMISELESGVVYRDYDGNELATLDDICKFIKEQGINHIRIRVWNNPYDANGNGYGGGNNDVAKAKQFADACRNAGLKMLVDFHCSDLWTDPSKQQVPKAWKGYTLEQKKEALNTYITESLNTIDPTKDVVDMVQVGNETTGGFIGESNVSNMCVLFSAGAAGVKTYNPDVKVVIHVESPHKKTMVSWAKNLQDNSVDYDILATSYYPYWHGTLENLKDQFQKVKNTYNKDVMVAETSYAYTLEDSDGHNNTVRVGNNDDGSDTPEPFTEQGQATAIRNLISTVNEAGGLGVFYWEPAWLTVGNTKGLTGDAYDAQVKLNREKWEKYGSGWASSYASEYDAEDAGKWYGGSAVDNEAMFYPDGTATPALHVWNYVKTGAVSNLVSVEGFENTLSQTITAGSSFTLPDTVAVTYSDDKTPVAETVIWNEADVKKADASKTGTYQILGTISLSKEITRGAYKGKNSADVTFTLEVTTPNLITNEDVSEINPSAQDLFEVTGDGVFKDIANSENPKSGATCMSWWSTTATTETVTYKEAITLEKGTYTFEAYAQGAQADVTMQILDTNDQVLATGDAAELTGWKDWKTPKVTFTLDKTTAIKLRVSVGIQESGWGSFDVLYLHEEKKDTTEENGNGSSSGSTGGTTSGSTGGTTSGSTTGGTTAGTGSSTAEGTTETPTPAPSDPAASDPVNVVTVKTESGENVQAAVNVEKDASGNVTKATATITDTKAVFSADVAAKLAEAAGTDSISIKAEVTDADGNTKYTVAVDAKNLVADKKLKVVAIDKKTGAYKLVNAKTYQVGKDGKLDLNLADGADYQLLTPAETKAVEKAILKTVTVDKKSATVQKGKTTKIQLSKKLDQDNVKKITYVSGKKSVATVSKNGKVTAKGKGTVTVKAKVTLNNGKTKTVSMKIKVK